MSSASFLKKFKKMELFKSIYCLNKQRMWKKMKKIICFILSLMVILSVFAGCSKEIENDVPNNEIVENSGAEENISPDQTEENKEENKKEENNKEQNNKNESSSSKEPSPSVKPPVTSPKEEPSLSSVMAGMVGVIPEGEHNLEEITPDFYKDIYGIDKSQFADVLIYGTMISVKANEIILIKVNNENEISKAVDLLTKRKEQVYKTWEQYLPDQFEMVKNGVIKTNGKYAALIIAPQVNKVLNKFNELTK